MPSGVATRRKNTEPDDVVGEGGKERLVHRDQVGVVVNADELDRAKAADPVPAREREDDRGDRRDDDEDDEDDRRHRDHRGEGQPVPRRQQAVAPRMAPMRCRPVGGGRRGGDRRVQSHASSLDGPGLLLRWQRVVVGLDLSRGRRRGPGPDRSGSRSGSPASRMARRSPARASRSRNCAMLPAELRTSADAFWTSV